MVSEGVLNLFGTSSEEIIARTRKADAEYYQPKIDLLSSQVEDLSIINGQLSTQNNNLSSQVTYLKSLLSQNNIPFHLEPESNG